MTEEQNDILTAVCACILLSGSRRIDTLFEGTGDFAIIKEACTSDDILERAVNAAHEVVNMAFGVDT